MAITILTRGTPPGERIATGTCHRCKTVARWTGSDGTHRDDQRDGEWSEIACPVCKNPMTGTYSK